MKFIFVTALLFAVIAMAMAAGSSSNISCKTSELAKACKESLEGKGLTFEYDSKTKKTNVISNENTCFEVGKVVRGDESCSKDRACRITQCTNAAEE